MTGKRRRRRRCRLYRRSSQSDAVTYLENGLAWESPHFTLAFIPIGSANIPDMSSLTNFRLAVIEVQKRSKMPPQTASGGISPEWFKRGSPNFEQLSETTGPTNRSDMTSLVASSRLRNAIIYCNKVMLKRLRVDKESTNSAFV